MDNVNNSRSVLITGASRGIGAATARAFAKEGYCIAINYFRSYEAAQELKCDIEGMGGRAEIYRADVSDTDAVEKMVNSAIADFGQIDVLVNNSGIAVQRMFTDITPPEWERIFAVNVTGTFYCTKAVIGDMIDRKSGKIINISSIWGITGASCEVHYSASKAAIIGFTKALAKEMGPSNIQVNCVAPGVIDTEMNGDLSEEDIAAICDATALGRLGSPDEVAQTVLFLASPKADFITGQVISPNGGITI